MNSDRNRRLRLAGALPVAAVAALALSLAACGSSSGTDAATLLKQTFTGTHKVDSGRLDVALTVTPSGSSLLKGPITLSLGGPFESRGAGKLPESDFTISLGLAGTAYSLGIISTGTSGYATFEGASYQLPQAEFQKLESSFAALKFVPGGTGSSVLHKLGIQPLHWLVKPQVVGGETVGGAPTTELRAGIDVKAFLNDLNTFLVRASSLGIPGATSFPQGISPASRSHIAGEIEHPTFDLWTGNSDKTIRRLQVALTLPVSGELSAVLGGSAGIALSMQYSDLNQPQTITAPSNLQPYAQFEAKLRTFFQGVTSSLGELGLSGAGGSSTGGSLGTTTSPPPTGTSAGYQAYSQCITAANGDVAKMQKCAPLLSSGG